MVAGWATTAGYRIVESGDSIEDAVNDGSNFFFMPNHQVYLFRTFYFCEASRFLKFAKTVSDSPSEFRTDANSFFAKPEYGRRPPMHGHVLHETGLRG